jgi:hypothetical protein
MTLLLINFSAAGALSLVFYYITILIGNINEIAVVFQPEINGEINEVLGRGRFWMLLFLVPVVAILPDIAHKFLRKIY